MARTKTTQRSHNNAPGGARPMNARERKLADFDELVRARLDAAAYGVYRNYVEMCRDLELPYRDIERVHSLIGQHADLWDGFNALMPKKKMESWGKAKDVLRAAAALGDDGYRQVVLLMEDCKIPHSAAFNDHMEAMWGLIGERAWESFRVFAPAQTKRWDELKARLDSMFDSAEFRKVAYKLKANVGPSYEFVDKAYHLFGKNDEAAWAGMKDMLVTAAGRLGDETYAEFLRCLHLFMEPAARKRNLKRIHGLIGSHPDAWAAFVGYFPDETGQFRGDLALPAPKGFYEDMLKVVLVNLTLPSMGRLSRCCKWFNLRISRVDLQLSRGRAMVMHGRFRLVPGPLFTIGSTNEEILAVRPNGRESRVFRVNGEIFETVDGRLAIAADFFDAFNNGDVLPNAKIWFRYEGMHVRVYVRVNGTTFNALLRRA